MRRRESRRRPAAQGSRRGRGARGWGPRCSSRLGLLSHGASGRQGGWGCRSAATPDAGHRNRRDDGTGRPTGQTHLNTEEHKDTGLQSRLQLLGEITTTTQASHRYRQNQKLSEVLIQTRAVQQKYNASHTCDFKFSSIHWGKGGHTQR